mmetsp:Transcript_71776/g.191523  ORF Transcript_71776/g.191523 Transcript_71776/m.191523 type:complete len:227 (-) Transcript_71776:4643-5323(-)
MLTSWSRPCASSSPSPWPTGRNKDHGKGRELDKYSHERTGTNWHTSITKEKSLSCRSCAARVRFGIMGSNLRAGDSAKELSTRHARGRGGHLTRLVPGSERMGAYFPRTMSVPLVKLTRRLYRPCDAAWVQSDQLANVCFLNLILSVSVFSVRYESLPKSSWGSSHLRPCLHGAVTRVLPPGAARLGPPARCPSQQYHITTQVSKRHQYEREDFENSSVIACAICK